MEATLRAQRETMLRQGVSLDLMVKFFEDQARTLALMKVALEGDGKDTQLLLGSIATEMHAIQVAIAVELTDSRRTQRWIIFLLVVLVIGILTSIGLYTGGDLSKLGAP